MTSQWRLKCFRLVEKAKAFVRNFGQPEIIQGGVAAGLRFDRYRSSGDYLSGRNELPVQQALAQHLKPGGVFFDIGSNVGFFALVGAKLVGVEGSVCAFEPIPENADCIRRNVELNSFKNVAVLQNAVSDASRTGEIHVTQHPGGATLASIGLPDDALLTIPIDIVSIDDLVAQKRVPLPDVVKIDVEGAEIDVLHGMAQTIQQARPVIVCEVDDEDETVFNQKRQACREFLEGRGYAVTALEESYHSAWKIEHLLAVAKG